MAVIQRRLLNKLNFSNKNTINFFNNTLDPIITDPDSGTGYLPFTVGLRMDSPKGFYYGNESEIKQSEHIKLNV